MRLATFASLGVRNYRLFLGAQSLSVTGMWMERIAQSWLVLKLTDSPMALGLTTAFQFGPILIAGLWGGVIADRIDPRRLLVVTQTAKAVLAVAVGLLVATGQIEVWMIYLAALLHGCTSVVDQPTRYAFIHDMVGPGVLPNAVALHSAIVHLARVVGPALSGGVIAVFGISVVFFVNAASYCVVVLAVAYIRVAELHLRAFESGRPRVRSGLSYVYRRPELALTALLLAVVALFVNNFNVTLALLAHYSFNGDAAVYGALTAMVAIGSVMGAVGVASRPKLSPRWLAAIVAVLGGLLMLLSMTPSPGLASVVLVPIGLAAVAFSASANAFLQLASPDEMRGRIMAIYTILFVGMKPIGGALAGWLGEVAGPEGALLVGGILAAVLGLACLVRAHTLGSHERCDVSEPAGRTGGERS